MRREPIFSGWWIVAATVIGLLFGYSTFVGITFGLFIKPLEEAFGWSRTQISFGLTLCHVLNWFDAKRGLAFSGIPEIKPQGKYCLRAPLDG